MEQKINPEHPKGSDSINTTRTVDASKAKKPKKGIKLFAVAVVLVALLVAAYFIFIYSQRNNGSTKVSNTCTEISYEVAPLLDARLSKNLEPYIAKIKSLPRYETDPDCIIPVAIYNINVSNEPEATKYYNILEAIKDKKHTISVAYYNKGIVSVASVKTLLDGLRLRNSARKGNTLTF